MTNNGFHGEFFSITRGIRQGCPISAQSFILCVEVLAIYIQVKCTFSKSKITFFRTLLYGDDNLNLTETREF